MVRPKCPRQVDGIPGSSYFKPRGIPVSTLEEVVLTIDEFEAIRLADHEKLYHEQAAEKMNISRQTFGRIIESAHKKVADVLINGKALKIEGGTIQAPQPAEMRKFRCHHCGHDWTRPFGTGKEDHCPSCGGHDFSREHAAPGCCGR